MPGVWLCVFLKPKDLVFTFSWSVFGIRPWDQAFGISRYSRPCVVSIFLSSCCLTRCLCLDIFIICIHWTKSQPSFKSIWEATCWVPIISLSQVIPCYGCTHVSFLIFTSVHPFSSWPDCKQQEDGLCVAHFLMLLGTHYALGVMVGAELCLSQ